MGSRSGPLPGWPACPPRWQPLPLRRSGSLNPGPSLEGGLEELQELRPSRSRSWARNAARVVGWPWSCSLSCLRSEGRSCCPKLLLLVLTGLPTSSLLQFRWGVWSSQAICACHPIGIQADVKGSPRPMLAASCPAPRSGSFDEAERPIAV